jgi:hypothetical protein
LKPAPAVAALILCAVVLLSARSSAQPRVAIVTSEPADAAEELNVEEQLRAELRAAGFDVHVVQTPESASAAALEGVARETGSFAAIAVVRVPGQPAAADVWVTDRVTGKTLLRRVRAEGTPDTSARILALRAVELLHASLIELNVPHPARGEATADPAVREFAAPASETDRLEPDASGFERFVVEAGAGLLAGPGGIPAAIAPAIALGLRQGRTWSARLFVCAPAISTVSAAPGTAQVDQELALLRVAFEPVFAGRFMPSLSMAAGAYRLGVAGDAAPPFVGQRGHAFAAAFGGGVAVRLMLSRKIGARLGADALIVAPRPVVGFAGRAVAEAARPMLVLSSTLEASW